FAGHWIVSIDSVASINYEFIPARPADYGGCAVGANTLASIHPPFFLSRLLLQSNQVRGWYVIALQDQQALVERGGAAVSPFNLERRILLTEVALPSEFSFHIQRHKLTGSEPGIDHLSVGDWAWAGEIVLLVNRCKPALRGQSILPELTSI